VTPTFAGNHFFFILHARTTPPPRATVDEPSCRQPKLSLEQSSELATSLVLLALSIFLSTLELDGFFLARLASMPQSHYVASWQSHCTTIPRENIGNAISYAFGFFCSIIFSKCVATELSTHLIASVLVFFNGYLSLFFFYRGEERRIIVGLLDMATSAGNRNDSDYFQLLASGP